MFEVVVIIGILVLSACLFVSMVMLTLDVFDSKPGWRQRRRLMEEFKKATVDGRIQWCWLPPASYRFGSEAEGRWKNYKIKVSFGEGKNSVRATYCSLSAPNESYRSVVCISASACKPYPLWDLVGLGRLIVAQIGPDYQGKLSEDEVADQCVAAFRERPSS